jgi:cysteine-rich repeat protein
MVGYIQRRRCATVIALWAGLSIAVAGCGDNELRACGNGVLEPGERCDDGNTLDGDGCDRNCRPTGCSNGIVTAGEACDDGNATNGDGCDRNCRPTGCGNGIVTAGEVCDDGNATNGDGCDANCTISACGNGAVAPGEGCDDGNDVDGDGCDSNCRPTGCGNGIVTAPEECDDGNAIDTDDCRNNCRVAACGDGVAATGATGARYEDCDGASLGGTAPIETSTCNLDCTARVCGDGKVNQTAGEECDDGNTSSSDACTSVCRVAACGDGFLRTTAPAEQCDDGNTVTEACAYGAPACTVCDATCALVPGETSACGDGIAQPPFEACDDGNAVNGDWCDVGCMAIPVAPSIYVKASNTRWDAEFGRTLALSADGSTLAVGAPYEDGTATGINGDQTSSQSNYAAGAVYVFVRSGTTWVQQAYVKSSLTDQQGIVFGSSVALSADGSTLAVGSIGVLYRGAVFVFTRSGTTWSQQADLRASNAGVYDDFGSSISLSGDGSTLAVGAPGEDSAATGIDGDQANNAASDSGAVYMFTRSGTTWSQQAYVKASNTGAGDYFGGVRLSDDGSTLAVGASLEDSAATGIDGDQANNAAPDSGAVYVFTRSGTTWSQQAYIKASNTNAGDEFGSIALSGDGATLAVGAFLEDSAATGINGNQADNSAISSGAVYVFTRSGMTWTQQAYVKASNTDYDDGFGLRTKLSTDGSTLAVGAYNESSAATGINGDQADDSAIRAGAVYRFTRSSTTWTQQAYVKASNTRPNNYFGFGLALSGDGLTLAAGAPWERSAATGIGGDQTSTSAQNAGAVYVFH